MTHIGCDSDLFRFERGSVSDPKKVCRIRALVEIYRHFDTMTRPSEIACRPGCSECCTRNVVVTTLEADLLHRWCRTDGDVDLAVFCAPALKDPRFLPLVTTNRVAELCLAREDLPEEVWPDVNLPCPLLENGRCRVYPARPFACRCMISSSPCRETGCADQTEWRVALNTLYLQVIEDLDQTGVSGNLVDLACNPEASRATASDILPPGIIRNRPMRKLFVPPQYQKRLFPVYRELMRVITPAGVSRSGP